jgi:hypothetical protein
MCNTLHINVFRTIKILSIFTATLITTGVIAQPTYYFPGSNINYTGGSNSFPLNASSTGSNKVQFLYRPSDFNTTPGTMLITKIYFKPATTRSNQSITNFTIKLANSSLTTLTTGSWLTGLTTVVGPTTTTISTTANSWYGIQLATPFLYTGGGLLMEMTHSGSATGISINQYTLSGRNGRLYGNASGSSGTANTATALFGFDGVPANCSGTPSAATITTSAMTTAAPLCAGSTKALAASNPNGPVTNLSFQWQSGLSSTGPFTNVTNGTGATTLNYTTGPISANTWFRVGIKCSTSGITTWSSAYQVRVGASQPGTISGKTTFCPGDPVTYSVPAVAGHTYTWTLPTGWSGTSISNSIVVTPGSSSGTISVKANGCGAISTARTLAIVPGSTPSTPAGISGKSDICPNLPQTYSVPAVTGASYYTWTLPNGWTGTSTTNSITLTPDTSNGTISVKAVNGCGPSPTATKTINVIKNLAHPGTVTSSAVNGVYCSGKLYSFSINPVPGATSYQWVLPSGWSGNNTGTSIQAFAGTTGGQVQVNAYVTCSTSPTASVSTPVNTSVTPTVSISPSSPIICSAKPNVFTASSTNGGAAPTYMWKKNGNTVTGVGATYTDATLVSGDVISVALMSSAVCKSMDTVRSNNITVTVIPTANPGISINSTPVITICSGTRLNFSTTIVGGGSAPTYQWYRNSTAISGATSSTYSGASFNNADTITVKLTTSAICYTAPVVTSNRVGIVVNPMAAPTVTISASSTAAGQPITFTATHTGGGATPAYQWKLNGVNIMGETNDTYTATALAAGDHISVMLQSVDPCAQPSIATSDPIIIGSATSIASTNTWDGTLNVFPNPSAGRFTVAVDWLAAQTGKRVAIDLYNLHGQLSFHSEVKPDRTKWSYDVQLTEAIPAGYYMLRLTTADGMKATVPVVIRK